MQKSGIVILVLSFMGWIATVAQPMKRVVQYDEEDGLPHGHVTQLLQDRQGFIWIATWNGLCRFDGYDFRTFKPQAGDGCHATTDRFRDIALRPDNQIVCRVDEDYFLFDTRTCRFRDMTPEEARQAPEEIKCYRQSRRENGVFVCTDHQGNQWMLADNGIRKICTDEQRTERLDINPQAQVKCLFTDREQRYWVCTKDDSAVRVYSPDGNLSGYLGRDGLLHQAYTCFGSPVYSMYQSADGTIWLGSKPDGLFRIRETSANTFKIDHFTELPDPNVYSIIEDHDSRLWIATLGGGLCYTDQPQSDHPRFTAPAGYPQDAAQRVRYLHITRHNILIAATTEGLVVARIEKNAQIMRFHLHQRETDRSESLSSSATMDITEDVHGRLYVSTESGGFNRIEDDDLLADHLTFRHFTANGHQLPNDVVMSLTPLDDNGMMVVGPHLVTLLDSTGKQRVLDARYFLADYRFSEAHPQRLSGGRWLFGLNDGAFITSTQQMFQQAYQPPVVLTGVSIQGGADMWVVGDTLTLQPRERSITVHFAALDFNTPERIRYAFRLLPSEQWNHIGRNRSATLLDLPPGTYRLEIRSTNADSEWQDNIRTLVIVVKPTFWESGWGHLLIVLIVAGILMVIAYTLLYIKRIKRKQHETLEAYLALLETRKTSESDTVTRPVSFTLPPSEIDPMLQRIMDFIESNISNADASVGDMAAAAATSRSGLQRKLKQAMGITPQDLLREARIKHACQLLLQSDRSIAEVAYASGFTDPKYFSRCFKQCTGQSPTEFKVQGKKG